MNILNYKGFEVNSIEQLVDMQKEVMFAFEPNLKERVENFDIDIYEDQMLIKDFLLVRTVEEITEASTALRAKHIEHFKEEIIDVFNFLVETSIILGEGYGITPKTNSILATSTSADPIRWYLQNKAINQGGFMADEDRVLSELMVWIEHIGVCTNLLKLRPWRESQYPVDLLTFKMRWAAIWEEFWLALSIFGFTYQELVEVWSKKYQVNKFRIESNY